MANKEATLFLKIKSAGEEVLDRISSGLGTVADVAKVGFTAIAGVVAGAIYNFRQQEEATNALTRAMINQGIYSKGLKDEYMAQASALQALTTFGDEQIIAAQGVLQGYLGQTKVSKELTQATLDLAAAKGIDLKSAAEMMGKSIGTGTNALARNGIEVDSNASKQEKLEQVLNAVNKRYGGQAAAAAEGYGAIQQLQNIMSDLLETIGERIQPVFNLFASKLKAFALDTENATIAVDGFMAVLKVLTDGGVIVAGVFEAVGKVIGTGLASALESVSAIMEGQFKKAFNIAKLGVEESGNAIAESYENTKNRLKEVDAAFMADTAVSQEKELQMVKESESKKGEVLRQARSEEAVRAMEDRIAQQEIEMGLLTASEDQRALAQINARIKAQEQILKNTTDSNKKLEALNEIHRQNELKKEELADQQRIKNRDQTFATIATLQNSSNKTLAAIGKAAAITQIAIETPVAIARALSAFPPPFNFAAAGLVGAAMAAQAANIAGVQLAEGGIVMPRPGGVQATIAEAGQAEAVIPLDRAGEFGLGGGGGGVQVIVYGGLLGDDATAREFARAVDRELLKLRQNNESVSFDSGVV